MASIDDLKYWWQINSTWMIADHWEECLELGTLIKALADEAKDVVEEDYPMSEHMRRPYRYVAPDPVQGPTDPTVKLPDPPYLGAEDKPAPRTWLTKKLDPLPYASFAGTEFEERFSINDPGRVYGFFNPRPEYEQSRERYGFLYRRGSA